MEKLLTAKEKARLKQLHRNLKDRKQCDRIKTILMLDDGYSSQEICKVLLIDKNTVTNWKKQFLQRKTTENWIKSSYKNYNGKLSKKEKRGLEKYVMDNIITDSQEAINYIQKEFKKTYSRSGIVNLLNRMGFVYKQTSLIPSKYDPEKQKEFKEKYEQISEDLPEDESILFMDGVHPQHNTTCTRAWIKRGDKKEVKSNTGRSRININGVYNPQTQEILFHEEETINAAATIEFLKEIENFYKEKSRIQIIVDNAKYYRNKAVREYLTTSKIEFLFLPPYSPNLNLIERLWKLMRKQVINNKYYEKFKDFRDAILGFFENSGNIKPELQRFIGTKLHLLEVA